MTGFGARLKEERERLGYGQEAFAALADASRKSQIRWEADESFPDAAQIAAWLPHGFDALYALSGRRSPETADCLPQDDSALLQLYRLLDNTDKELIRSVLTAFATRRKSK